MIVETVHETVVRFVYWEEIPDGTESAIPAENYEAVAARALPPDLMFGYDFIDGPTQPWGYRVERVGDWLRTPAADHSTAPAANPRRRARK